MTRFDYVLMRPRAFLSGTAAAMAIAAIAALGMAPAPQAVAAVVAAAEAAPVAAAPVPRERDCASCGFVETIKRTDPGTGLTSYEFTVRMRDGSARDSTETGRGRWLEGDRVILIGGAAARALEIEKNAAL
ncbi:hypothetical protein HK414_20735 [Ramlibacter terrae]|uniref:DUF2147 domain-containing protein n=1 Tax=Ramlibacter terrae TaxID=2732511 RepID=A0ABX6P4Q2_9BURK|nr:hypothetical protein HK414_20735 [Ramlibacter terrae]